MLNFTEIYIIYTKSFIDLLKLVSPYFFGWEKSINIILLRESFVRSRFVYRNFLSDNARFVKFFESFKYIENNNNNTPLLQSRDFIIPLLL